MQKTAEKKEFVRTTFLYFLGRALFRLLFATLWRLKVRGQENIPPGGGVVIAPNHASLADPPLVGASMHRPLFFMAKEELFSVPVLGFLIRRTNAFPVKRGRQDIAAFRGAVKLLREGGALLIFPEGTRSKDGAFGRARPGIGMIAGMAGVPVIPVRVTNTSRLLAFKKISVVFGKPLLPPGGGGREIYQEFSERILNAIKALPAA